MTAAGPGEGRPLQRAYQAVLHVLELVLSGLLLVGVLVTAAHSVRVLAGMDWSRTATFDELVSRALVVVIGLEVIRMLILHDLSAVLELLGFAIARKMLRPDVTALDLMLGTVGFVGLLAARHYFLRRRGAPAERAAEPL